MIVMRAITGMAGSASRFDPASIEIYAMSKRCVRKKAARGRGTKIAFASIG
jgi:hypothetical protein